MEISGGLLPTERFAGASGSALDGVAVGDFWRWAYSDLVQNTNRGVPAEFIVGVLLEAIREVRDPWANFDVTSPGGVRVEVKASAYKQAWFQERPSRISFSVGESSAWDENTYERVTRAGRNADVYVFCLLGEPSLEEVDPLALDSWSFFVVPTGTLNERLGPQKTAALSTIERLAVKTNAAGLPEAVARASRATPAA